MRTEKLISIALILILMLAAGGCKEEEVSNKSSLPSWKVVSEIKTEYPNNNSYFINNKIGITVGAGGEVHFTEDGGKKWGNGRNRTQCLFNVCMINDKVALACGNGAFVVKTLDGGASWKAVTGFGEAEPNHPRYLSFIDENTGWIATPTEFSSNGRKFKLGCTKDGGKTWSPVEIPNDTGRIAAINLRTENDGYVLDDAGNLYITRDGGKSFSKQPIELKDIDLLINYAPNIALKFSDAENALICYLNKDGKLQAARSSDGGKTWIKDAMPEIWGGSLSLSREGNILTSTSLNGSIKVLNYDI